MWTYLFPDDTDIFQDDSAEISQTRTGKDYLREHEKSFSHIHRPAESSH